MIHGVYTVYICLTRPGECNTYHKTINSCAASAGPEQQSLAGLLIAIWYLCSTPVASAWIDFAEQCCCLTKTHFYLNVHLLKTHLGLPDVLLIAMRADEETTTIESQTKYCNCCNAIPEMLIFGFHSSHWGKLSFFVLKQVMFTFQTSITAVQTLTWPQICVYEISKTNNLSFQVWPWKLTTVTSQNQWNPEGGPLLSSKAK